MSSPAYDETMIARGLKVYVGIDSNGGMVPALLAGTVTAADILTLVHHDFGNAGVWWGIMGTFGDIVDFEDYAYSDGLLAQTYGDLEGGEVSIVLVGKRPSRDGQPWDPEHHNPPEAGGLMGNSYLQSGEQVELVEVRYDAGHGWRSLPAAGLRATASSGIPGMTIEEEWDLPSMGPGERAVTARIDGRLVGGLLWQVSDGIINYVQVDPEHRRRGIASALLEAARRLDPNVRHDVEENRSETGKEWVRAVGSKTAVVGEVKHQTGVPFSNYRFSGQAHRFYIEDPEAPDYGGGNFAGSTPKTVAFLDVFDAGDWVDIAFLTTRGKFEGAGDYQRQGLAGRLVEAAYDYFAPKKIYWGRIMHDGAEALKNRYRQSHPQRTGARTAGANGTLPPLTFRYDDHGDGSGRIVPFDPANDDWHAKQFGVGMISWNTEGKITWVQSYEGYERRGLATRMLEEARKHRPDIHHSEDLSQDAQGWIRSMGGLQTYYHVSGESNRSSIEEHGLRAGDGGVWLYSDPERVRGIGKVWVPGHPFEQQDIWEVVAPADLVPGHQARDQWSAGEWGEDDPVWVTYTDVPPSQVRRVDNTTLRTASLKTYYHVTNYSSWPQIRANGLQPGPDGKVWLWDSVGHALHFADAWSNPAVPPCILVVRTEATVEPTHWGDAWTLPGAIEVYDVIRPEDFGHYQRDLDQFRQGSRTASGGGTIYRGVRMPFSDEIIGCFKAYEEREEMSERRSYKAGPLILDALERYIGRHSTGVGIHWSTRPEMAGVAAETGGQFRDFPVIIEATYTDADVVPEGDPLYHESGVWVGNGIEAEVLIKPGARLNVTGVWIVRGPWNYQTPSVDKCPKMNVRGDEYVNVLASPQRRTARQYFPLPEKADGPILRNWNGYSQESQQRILATYVDLVEGTARPEPKQREPLVGLWTVKISDADRIIVDDLPGGGWVLLGAVFDHNYALAEQQIAGWLAWRQRTASAPSLATVVEEFQRDYGQRLLDPAEAHDRCKDYSDEFASRCQEAGIAAEVVSGLKFGEIPELPGQRLVLGGHFAVQVGTTVYDWTARQFDPGAPVPLVVTIDQWRDEWLRLGSSIAG